MGGEDANCSEPAPCLGICPLGYHEVPLSAPMLLVPWPQTEIPTRKGGKSGSPPKKEHAGSTVH